MLRQAFWVSCYLCCLDVIVIEVLVFVGVSERLRTIEGFELVFESFVVWVVWSVVVYEFWYVEDVWCGGGEVLVCSGCFEGMLLLVCVELLVYFVMFVMLGIGYFAALQACVMFEVCCDGYALVIELVMSVVIFGGCSGDVGVGFYARAAQVQERYFGARRSAAILDVFLVMFVVFVCFWFVVSDVC